MPTVSVFPPKPNGQPYKIAARGDCTSRRTLALNSDFFDRKAEFIQNQKSPFVMSTDAVAGKAVSLEYLRELSDVASMTPVLRDFYLGQGVHSIINAEGVDLVILDSYADMNFELWERVDGAKLWIHPKHVYDMPQFLEQHRKLGRRTLEQSVADAKDLIEHIRKMNPDVPVLFLNQQTDFYSKLDDRVEEYYALGELVAKEVPGVYYGGVEPKHSLDLADVGSCGPDQTLHFQGPTYRRMVERAGMAGLFAHLERRNAQYSAQAPAQQTTVAAASAGSSASASADEWDWDNLPKIDLGFELNSPTCIVACERIDSDTRRAFTRYFTFDGEPIVEGLPPAFVPMIIDMSQFRDFDDWEKHIKSFGKGARIRQKNKAIRMGYYTKPFRWHMHIPDIYEANTSMPERSGGEIRAGLKRTVEELGGAPTRELPVVMPKCKYHWSMAFGVFLHEPGHKQGDVITNERLVGYITPRRLGDLVSYSQILGHGEHLPNGALTLLHHDVMRWIFENDMDDGYTDGVKYVMYTGLAPRSQNELVRFKRQAGFRPTLVDAVSPGKV